MSAEDLTTQPVEPKAPNVDLLNQYAGLAMQTILAAEIARGVHLDSQAMAVIADRAFNLAHAMATEAARDSKRKRAFAV